MEEIHKELEALYEEISKSKIDAFQYKANNQYFEFDAAFEEGSAWMELGYRLEKSDELNIQSYIAVVYSCELFLKSILIKSCKNINTTHDLYKLFKRLDNKTQIEIKNNMNIFAIGIIDQNNKVTKELNKFEDFLKYISQYFKSLRYGYERIGSNTIITVPTKFINDFAYTLYKFCKNNIYSLNC